MFVLAKDETEELVTNCDRFASMKHSSVPMRAFSEHGVIMVASVLKSDIAAQISVRITRMFVAIRNYDAKMASMLLDWLKMQIASVCEICFAAGAVKDREKWANVLWYKNLVDADSN